MSAVSAPSACRRTCPMAHRSCPPCLRGFISACGARASAMAGRSTWGLNRRWCRCGCGGSATPRNTIPAKRYYRPPPASMKLSTSTAKPWCRPMRRRCLAARPSPAARPNRASTHRMRCRRTTRWAIATPNSNGLSCAKARPGWTRPKSWPPGTRARRRTTRPACCARGCRATRCSARSAIS